MRCWIIKKSMYLYEKLITTKKKQLWKTQNN